MHFQVADGWLLQIYRIKSSKQLTWGGPSSVSELGKGLTLPHCKNDVS
jgi:hypothetical protein